MNMDLDKFKPVNDRLGHQAGDLALQQVAQRLGGCFRKTDTLARLGGDEFAAILPEPGQKNDLEAMAQRILDEINRPFLLDGQSCDLGITIGVCMASESGESMKTLIHRADTALYRGKEVGRNCYRFG